MFGTLGKNNIYPDKNIQVYSLKSTNEYVKKIIEKTQKEKEEKQVKFHFELNDFKSDINNDENKNTPNNYIFSPFCLFLSISSLLFLYSNRK